MAGFLSNCLGFSVISNSQSKPKNHVGGCRNNMTIVPNDSLRSYYPESIPMVQQLGFVAPASISPSTEEYSTIKHLENLVRVKNIILQVDDPLDSLLTVDYLQKLGIDYQFREVIDASLASLYDNTACGHIFHDLFPVSLSFRLLRHAGYPISSNVFGKFTDKHGNFRSQLKTDIQGLLSLYEASHMNTGEEILLYRAKEFASKHLDSICRESSDSNVRKLVRHSLENPCHKTVSRYNARYYLGQYCSAEDDGMNGVVEELARMDFNLVQSQHQKELKQILSWWKSTGLAEELKFARKQPLKWYLWPMTMLPEPQFSTCRIQITKVIAFVYIIDDIFDVYGSPDELSLFTNLITKWDLSMVDTLPSYMRSCYTTLYNITYEIAQSTLKQHGYNPINSLKKSWARLCDAFLLESAWLRSKQVPNADEYLRNGVISSGLLTVLLHVFFLLGQGITEENVRILERDESALLSSPAAILRLWDDLGSAKDENQEGFDGSYVECYMKDHQSSEEDAREHVKEMIGRAWERLNKECCSDGHFAPTFQSACLNCARMVEVMYRYEEHQKLPLLQGYINLLLFKSM